MLDYGLKDKVIIITGANNPQGIGAATAPAFSPCGSSISHIICHNLSMNSVLQT